MAQFRMSAVDLLRPETADAAFRDPDARVHAVSERILRAIPPVRLDEFLEIYAHPAVADLVARGALTASTFVPPPGDDAGNVHAVHIEHPAIDFVSYPYEWPFAGLRAAALHYLDLQLSLLDHGFFIASASAYDLQFQGVRPVFMDPTRIRVFRDGEPWRDYAGFCREFLYPLLLTAKVGLPYQPWYRGAGAGIDGRTLATLLPAWTRFDPRMRMHVFSAANPGDAPLSRTDFVKLLRRLRGWVASLEPRFSQRRHPSPPADLRSANEQIAIFDVVRDFVGRVHPGMLLDLSCAGGDYSALALRSGAAAVVGVDADPAAADQAFRRAERARRDMLVLTMDVAEPSPAQGWPHRAQRSFAQRARFDALLALRLLPRLTGERGVPLEHSVRWLVALAPTGVIEFNASDHASSEACDRNEAVCDEQSFTRCLSAQARIVRREVVSPSGRALFVFDRR